MKNNEFFTPGRAMSFTAPLPTSSGVESGDSQGNGFENMSGMRTQPAQGMTQGLAVEQLFGQTFLSDIIGGEKMVWSGYEDKEEEEENDVPDLDDFHACPFISVAINGEELRLPLSTTDTTQDAHAFAVSPSMDPFPSHRFFSLHLSMLIPFDTERDDAWNTYEYDVSVEFSNDSNERRSYFLGTLNGGLQPSPVFNEKVLFKPTNMIFRVTTRNWRASHLPDAGRPDPHVQRLIASILKLLELKCVTGSGPIKATRLRSDIKETASNELIIAGLREMKWTEFLKKLNDQGYLCMTSRGQENWVSLQCHDKDDCTNFLVEKRSIAQCMTQLLQYGKQTPISEAMDMLFEHPRASFDLWKMMSPNWKTLRRILVSPEAQELGIHLDPCGDDCALVYAA